MVRVAVDKRHTKIGGRHRALSRYYMILNRLKTTERSKNSCYENVKMLISKEDFVEWFMKNDFAGASVDRINKDGNYTLDNIQLIPLAINIAKDKMKAKDGFCVCYACGKEKPLAAFATDNRRSNGHATLCRDCDKARGREKYRRLYRSVGK